QLSQDRASAARSFERLRHSSGSSESLRTVPLWPARVPRPAQPAESPARSGIAAWLAISRRAAHDSASPAGAHPLDAGCARAAPSHARAMRRLVSGKGFVGQSNEHASVGGAQALALEGEVTVASIGGNEVAGVELNCPSIDRGRRGGVAVVAQLLSLRNERLK